LDGTCSDIVPSEEWELEGDAVWERDGGSEGDASCESDAGREGDAACEGVSCGVAGIKKFVMGNSSMTGEAIGRRVERRLPSLSPVS